MPSTSSPFKQEPVSRNWEDMLQDEKIEKLMNIATHMYIRIQQLDHEKRQLQRHKHNERGTPIIEQEINGMDHDIEERIEDNPFNSKEIEESAEQGY